MSFEINLGGLATVPQPYISSLLRAHTGLNYQNGSLQGVAAVTAECIEQDISFTLKYDIPAENTASRLETYSPNNSTQIDLLDKAQFLARSNGRFMGLFAIGGAGVGKSHVAIGLAKSLEMSGQASRYVHVPSCSQRFIGGEPKPDETIIIDDLNDPWGWGINHFSKIITEMHNNGSGKLFITSNISEESVKKFFINMIGGRSSEDPEVIRIIDRVGVALRLVPVIGQSFRSTRLQDPWADYQPGGQPQETGTRAIEQ